MVFFPTPPGTRKIMHTDLHEDELAHNFLESFRYSGSVQWNIDGLWIYLQICYIEKPELTFLPIQHYENRLFAWDIWNRNDCMFTWIFEKYSNVILPQRLRANSLRWDFRSSSIVRTDSQSDLIPIGIEFVFPALSIVNGQPIRLWCFNISKFHVSKTSIELEETIHRVWTFEK